MPNLNNLAVNRFIPAYAGFWLRPTKGMIGS